MRPVGVSPASAIMTTHPPAIASTQRQRDAGAGASQPHTTANFLAACRNPEADHPEVQILFHCDLIAINAITGSVWLPREGGDSSTHALAIGGGADTRSTRSVRRLLRYGTTRDSTEGAI